MIVIDHTQNNGSVEIAVGDSFRLQLGENPTTGYRWRLDKDGAPMLRTVEDSFEGSSGGLGGGGVRYWVFAAEQPGAAALSLELRRGWQPQATGAFSIAVNVKARAGSR
jgi:inhibitor of cysteine peptidase